MKKLRKLHREIINSLNNSQKVFKAIDFTYNERTNKNAIKCNNAHHDKITKEAMNEIQKKMEYLDNLEKARQRKLNKKKKPKVTNILDIINLKNKKGKFIESESSHSQSEDEIDMKGFIIPNDYPKYETKTNTVESYPGSNQKIPNVYNIEENLEEEEALPTIEE